MAAVPSGFTAVAAAFLVSASAGILFARRMYDRFLRTTIRDNVDGV
jgi:hypothetical protein